MKNRYFDSLLNSERDGKFVGYGYQTNWNQLREIELSRETRAIISDLFPIKFTGTKTFTKTRTDHRTAQLKTKKKKKKTR